jgi:hypothetical protein
MDMRFGMWNGRCLYRAGSVMRVAKEISKYELDLVGVQEVRLDRGGTEPTDEYTFLCGKGNKNHELGTFSFVHKRLKSAVNKVEFVSDSMPYVILRGRWYDFFVLNVCAPTGDKIDDEKDSFYEELEHVLDKFPK